MKHVSFIASALIVLSFNCKNNPEKVVETASTSSNELHETINNEEIKIIPINHATMVLSHKDQVVYVDPVGGIEAFSGQEQPDYILITDIHGDHLDPTTFRKYGIGIYDAHCPSSGERKVARNKG